MTQKIKIILFCVGIMSFMSCQPSVMTGIKMNPSSIVGEIVDFRNLDNGKWTKCFQTADGTIYLHNHLKISKQGNSLKQQNDLDLEAITSESAGATLIKRGLFFAVDAEAHMIKQGVYKIKAWRSTDELKTLRSEEVVLYVPEGPDRSREKDEFYGIGVYRTIIEMRDGSWLMTMYGNFRKDLLTPQGKDAQLETKFMMRTFVVKSTDEGRTWHYLSTVAAPNAGDPIGEGFVEPTMTLLDNGKLLCIMRTGHHYPLYASWSSDGGKTWTPPEYTGLDRGCAPCVIKLLDGRIALSWGRRYPEGWSKITSAGDQSQFKYPGEGHTNLAISDDDGKTWFNHKVATRTGSCYSTIIEVEPNVIFFQVDQWVWRLRLKSRTDLSK
jgi:hypothetical protein